MGQLWVVGVSYKDSSLYLWLKVVTSYHPSVFLSHWYIYLKGTKQRMVEEILPVMTKEPCWRCL